MDQTNKSINTGCRLERSGKLRILKINYSISTQIFCNIPEADRPRVNSTGSGRCFFSSKYYPSVISVLTDGDVSASYYIPNTATATAITSGTIVGDVVWVV